MDKTIYLTQENGVWPVSALSAVEAALGVNDPDDLAVFLDDLWAAVRTFHAEISE